MQIDRSKKLNQSASEHQGLELCDDIIPIDPKEIMAYKQKVEKFKEQYIRLKNPDSKMFLVVNMINEKVIFVSKTSFDTVKYIFGQDFKGEKLNHPFRAFVYFSPQMKLDKPFMNGLIGWYLCM